MSEPEGDTSQADRLGQLQARIHELELSLEQRSRELHFLTERYESLLESITDYVYRVQIREGRVVETQHSPACVAVTGYSSQDFAADPMLWIQMVHPSDRSAVTELTQRILAGEQVHAIEHRVLHKNGSHRWVSNAPVLRRDSEGRLVGYDGIIRDITEHKRNALALQELREHQHRAGQLLTTILSNTFVGAIYLDTEFNFLWVNEAFAKTCATPASAFPGKNFFALFPQFGSRKHFLNVVTSREPHFGTAVPIEFADQPERGVTYWDYSLYPIPDATHGVVGLVLTVAEVTARIRIEEQLRASELRYRTVANYTYDWECWETADGKLAYCSPSCLRVTGHHPEEFLNDPRLLDTLVHPDDLPTFQRYRVDVAKSLSLRELDFRITKPDGVSTWLSQRAAPVIAEDGTHLGWRSSTRDITDRKRIELQLRTQADLLNLSPVCVTVHDELGRFSYANEQALDLHGYSRDEFFARTLPDLRTRESAALFDEQIRELRHVGSLRFQVRHVTKTGEICTLWTEARATMIEGKVAILNVASNITDRVRAMQALAESESTLRTMFDAVGDAIMVVEPDGNIVMGNAVAASYVSMTLDEMLRHSVFELADKSVAEQRKQWFDSVLEHGKIVRFEDERDGRYLEHSLFPIADPSGTVVRIAVFTRDTTERRRAEDRLKRTNELLLSLRDAQSRFMTTGDPTPVYSNLLETLVELSCSEFGFLERIGTAGAELQLAQVGADPNCMHELRERLAPRLAEFRRRLESNDERAALAPLIIQSDHMLSGDAAETACSCGRLRSFIGIPLLYGGEVVGFVGLANRRSGYDFSLLDHLAPFTSTCASTIRAVETTQLYRAQGVLLRDSEETKRAIIETVPGLVYRIALYPSVRLLYVSAGVTRVIGFGADELTNPEFDVLRFIPAEEIPRLIAALEEACRSGHPGELDLKVRDERAMLRWIHVRGQVTKNDKGEAEYVDGVAIDISERKRAEEALAAKTAELEAYFNSALDLLCIADVRGNFRRLNPAWTITLGYGLDELEGASFMDLVHPDDKEATQRAVAQLSEQQTVHLFTNRYRHRDGSYRYIEWRSRPCGELIYAAARDVTEKTLAQAALRESESRFRTLVENTPDVIAHFDADGRALYVSPSGVQFGGFPPELWIGKTYAEVGFPKAQAELWQARLERVLQTEQPDEAEVNLETQQRGTVVFNWRLLPVYGRDGVKSVLSLARDITEQKRLEREYLALFNEMLSGLVVLEAISGPEGAVFDERILAANPAFERLVGMSTEDVIGKTLLELLPRTEKRWVEVFGQVAITGIPAHFEANFSDLGRLFDVTAFRTAPQQLACIFTDVSERRLLQEQYHQSNKLEAIGRLATGIAHDLNNLLMPILGYSDALLELTEPDDAITRPVTEIRSAGLQAKDLVRQLLSFGRRQQLEVRCLDLNAVVSSFGKLLERALRENVRLSLATSPSPLWVNGDVGQLELVLMNLAVHAQDRMPAGGHLSITLVPSAPRRSLPPAAGEPKGEAVLVVKDDGAALERETQERLFEPFFTIRTNNRGEGLGLAAVHGIVMQHGGSISVWSEPGQGVEFTIRLPAIESRDERSESDSQSPPSKAQAHARGRILVVEDNPLVRDLTVRALESQGYFVQSAANAKECLAALTEWPHSFDLLLTDVVMPDMSGKALFEILAARFQGLGVVYMSGYSREFILQQHHIEGDATFLQKPFSMRRLVSTIRRVLVDPSP
jgi:PAS domain S-box-containing protein